MWFRRKRILIGAALSIASSTSGAASELADAIMAGDAETASMLIERGVDVNLRQVDGSTALHWAARLDDAALASALIVAGADVTAANRAGVTPMRLAAINGSAQMIELLLDAGVDPDAPLTPDGDTALMMAAGTGILAAVQLLIERGAAIDAAESWGGTTALMWAITEHHPAIVDLLISRGAALESRSHVVPLTAQRGVEGTDPVPYVPHESLESYYNGGFTPLLFAAREGQIEAARMLIEAGAEVNAIAADGKNTLGLAIYNGHYALASYLIDVGVDVNQADAERFPPLFWAVDRRNMEWNPGFPWTINDDPLPLARKLLEAGADPNFFIDNRPESRRNFGGSPRILFASSLMRAAYSGDVELVRLLLEFGADPLARNSDNETPLLAAAGYGWIDGYSQGRSNEERLETIKLLVELGADVNWACNDGITPLMVAANFGVVEIIQYLVDQGADLAAHDLGKKNDGIFGGSIEPLMPLDYAIGVGTFRPNNAILHMAEATELMTRMMAERGIVHTTSECTLRAFSCGPVDPQGSTPSQIAYTRSIQVGNQVEGITGGLEIAADSEERNQP
jgi:ankyrin repeat protein